MDAQGNVKLTNISVEREIDIPIEPTDWQNQFHKYIHLCPRVLFKQGKNCEERKYQAQDDMYSVGIIMWEIWTDKEPWTSELSEWPPNNMDKFYTTLLSFWELRTKHIGQTTDILSLTWKGQMIKCVQIDHVSKAREWLKAWEGHSGYPAVSVVFQSKSTRM